MHWIKRLVVLIAERIRCKRAAMASKMMFRRRRSIKINHIKQRLMEECLLQEYQRALTVM